MVLHAKRLGLWATSLTARWRLANVIPRKQRRTPGLATPFRPVARGRAKSVLCHHGARLDRRADAHVRMPRAEGDAVLARPPPVSARTTARGGVWTVGGPWWVEGTLRPAGDKSIAHRAVLLAALARGTSDLHGLPNGEDVGRTIAAMRDLGVAIDCENGEARLAGTGLRGLQPPRREIDCGNSGTTMRLLCGVLAAQPFAARLAGDASLLARPMRRVAEPLERMGARIDCLGTGGRPPLEVRSCERQLD